VAVWAVRPTLGRNRRADGLIAPALNVFVIARQHETWIEPASVAVLIGTFASVVTRTSVMWMLQTGKLVFP
jgi:malonate transporter and related proteins